ncbi:MAG: SH3 domain-containing protein [Leptospiraceae bacterium]|nr:SH3 domain-containing protein [Leptospiraceae bacterium]
MKSLLPFFLFFSFAFTLSPEEGFVIITSGKLNLRDKPEKGKVIGKLKKGEKVEILPEETGHYEWAKVRAGKKIGFVSKEFISSHQPKDLDRAMLIGDVFPGEKPEVGRFRVIAYRSGSQWKGADLFDPDVKYILKSSVTGKSQFAVTDNSGKFKLNAKIDNVSTAGCQSYTVGEARIGKILSEESEESTFFLSDKLAIQPVELSGEIHEDIKSALEKKARNNFLARNPDLKDENVKMDSAFVLEDGRKSETAILRFSEKKEYEEKQYIIFVVKINQSKIEKILFEESNALSVDQAPYGGKFHFKGSFHLKGEGTYIIFHHNGFDGFINEIFLLKENTFKPVTTGGGDAC